ncbi:MAG: hypothetical protein GY828_05950 [Candidatus Gracilibacteria bacterium]|nr:hypothetical protein [Candidatus Gracilibacteria bacterium]
MNLIVKILLALFTAFVLFSLIFFTFLVPSYTQESILETGPTQTGTYIIGDNYSLSPQQDNIDVDSTKLLVKNIFIGNQIFYRQGDVSVDYSKDIPEIILTPGIYLFDLNNISSPYIINIMGSKITPEGPGTFIINTLPSSQNTLYSYSSTLQVNLLDTSGKNVGSNVSIFPNMLIKMTPSKNDILINVDLLQVKKHHPIAYITDNIYSHPQLSDDNGTPLFDKNDDPILDNKSYKLLPLLQKHLFYSDVSYDHFIKDILEYRAYKKDEGFKKINILKNQKKQIFPGESYILKYSQYFLNEEKKIYYYKNLILREIALLLKSPKNDTKDLFQKIDQLKELSPEHYKDIHNFILSNYEYVITSQTDNFALLTTFTHIVTTLEQNASYTSPYSLLQLRSFYESLHTKEALYPLFYKDMNTFVELYDSEVLNATEQPLYYNQEYFFFFLKNILISDFSHTNNVEEIISLLKQYIYLHKSFIELGDISDKKTALFDNSQLIGAFLNILKTSFFEKNRNDRDLLLLLKSPKMNADNYQSLRKNLQTLMTFQAKNIDIIENSTQSKDIILSKTYKKFNTQLTEYVKALGDYNAYEIEYDKIDIKEPTQEIIDPDRLTHEKAQIYLSQFNGVSPIQQDIEILDYNNCIHRTDGEITVDPTDLYCYHIKNLSIDHLLFDFILTPIDGNEISYLSYTNQIGNTTKISAIYQMDLQQERMDDLRATAPIRMKHKYLFANFFRNNFITPVDYSEKEGVTQEDQPFPIPELVEENSAIEGLKSKLFSSSYPLSKIRNVLEVTYKYLIVSIENNEYIINIHPTKFRYTVTNKQNNSKSYTAYFEARYISNQVPHLFSKAKIYVEQDTEKKDMYFGKKPIYILDDFDITTIDEIFEKIFLNFKNISTVYTQLDEKYNDIDITLQYNNIENTIIFSHTNGYSFQLDHKGILTVVYNNTRMNSYRYNNIQKFLNTLP